MVAMEIIRIHIGGPPIQWYPLRLELPTFPLLCIDEPLIQCDSCGRWCWEAILHPPIHFRQPPIALSLSKERVHCTCILASSTKCGLAFHVLRFTSKWIALTMRCTRVLNTGAGQVALCVDTRRLYVLLPLCNHKVRKV